MTTTTRSSAAGDLARRIVGSWELVEYRTADSEGNVHHPLGTDARGVLIYSTDGMMSAQIMRVDRPVFRSQNVHGGGTEERAGAAAGYLAYSGPYEVDERSARILHRVQVSLFPNWVGSDQFRIARCDEGRLELSSDPLVFRTTTLYPTLIWRR